MIDKTIDTIIDADVRAEAGAVTLDDLFRRAGVRRPDAPALIDPPNRAGFTDGAPRTLTFSEADRAISSLAARLRGLGLSTDTVVALQLPNTVEGVITLLGVLRAGMVAVPLPLLWRKQETVAALGRVGAKAIVTCARAGATAQAEIAMQAAAELFPIRFVFAFGNELPDGVVPLDDVFTASLRDLAPSPRRIGNAAAVTFDITAEGPSPVKHTHRDLIAAGAMPFGESGMAADTAILSTIPPSSFAGLTLTLLPWLLAGGTLSLHHGFDPATFAAQQQRQDAVVLPGVMIPPLAAAGYLGTIKGILALWREPKRFATATPWDGGAALVDVAAFREGDLWARRRTDGMPAPVPSSHLIAPRGGLTAIGGYRFVQEEVDGAVARADPSATIVALPDALLGQRYAGSARDPDAVGTELQALGVNSLVAGAFRPRLAINPA